MLAELPSPLRKALLRLGRDELEALVTWGQERVAYFDKHPEDDPATWPEDEREPPIPAAQLEKLVLTADRRKRRGSKARRVADDYPVRYRLEYVRCGRDTCRCASKVPEEMHGPYWYSYKTGRSGKTVSKYVGKKLPEGVIVDRSGRSARGKK